MRGRLTSFLYLLLVAALLPSCGDDSSTGPPPPLSPYQPAIYREAGRITAAGLRAAMTDALPGQTELEVKGVIDTTFAREGCTVPAFEHIVAAGPHAVDLHYFGDDGVLEDGELLLVDIGATSEEICSDATRTFPVGPAFTARQRELYDLVLNVHRQVTAAVRPGTDSLRDLDSLATALFASSPLRARTDSGTERTMDAFFTHFLGHFVGKSVHGEDVPWFAYNPFEVGQVVAIEPGLYIASEGFGIRVEDTFLVTSEGLECLTCGCPKEPAEIEALRAAAGVPGVPARAAPPVVLSSPALP